MQDPSPATPGPRVEAARYALLRRLAFAMRHNMVVHLQPISMITEVLERRLQAPSPDIAKVHESMGKINGFSRAAVQSCLDVVSWLAPEAGVATEVGAGVDECLALLRSHLSFRGFAVRNEVGASSFGVDRTGLRHVLPACLLALTDGAVAPAEVVLSLETGPSRALLTLAVRTGQGPAGEGVEPTYRMLAWDEVEALAQAEGMALERTGESVRLVLPAATH